MAAPASVIDYSGRFRLPATPAVVWRALEQVDGYQAWCDWLSELDVDGGALAAGAVLHAVVSPPLPYHLRVHITLVDCVAERAIDATVRGDLDGHGTLRLEPDGDGTTAAVTWTIEVMQRPLRLMARLARPVVLWGHDRIVAATLAGFCRHLDEQPR